MISYVHIPFSSPYPGIMPFIFVSINPTGSREELFSLITMCTLHFLSSLQERLLQEGGDAAHF
jgi:hypothetical protein